MVRRHVQARTARIFGEPLAGENDFGRVRAAAIAAIAAAVVRPLQLISVCEGDEA
jgi:hypothetical protein